MQRNATRFLALLIPAFWLAASGCISRVLEIRTDPPRALVYLDGREIGRAPLEKPFLDYGYHRILIAKEGYQPINRIEKISAPWWCCFPFDLFAELWPGMLQDRHKLEYRLEKTKEGEADLEKLLQNLNQLRQELTEASREKNS